MTNSQSAAKRCLPDQFKLIAQPKPLSPEHLVNDFGVRAPLAQAGVGALYEAISATDQPQALCCFNQWKRLYGEVCGYDLDQHSNQMKRLSGGYGIKSGRGFKPAELLFAVHSYYAIFLKLLAAEIVAFFTHLPSPLQKLQP